MKTNWLPYTEARSFVHKLKFKTVTQWVNYSKSEKRPYNIPSNPRRTYKKEWKGMGDWLGTDYISNRDKVFRSFTEAREFARALNLSGENQWREYCKSGNKPDDIPSNPNTVYKNEFKGMGDFLGTGTVANYNKVFRPYKEAREFVRTLGLKNASEWKEYCKSGNKPDDIPSAPWNTYKKWKKK